MEFKIGDKVKNKINGKKGKITSIYYCKPDMDIVNGIYNDNYKVKYDDNKNMWNSIAELEKIQDILDKYEKKYLTNVIKPFKDRVKCIYKKDSFTITNGEVIVINVSLPDNIDDYDSIILPTFKRNTMYKKMESYRKYTLKELNLD